MPIKASAKKAQRQSVKRAAENKAKKDAFKKAVKEVKKLVVAKKLDEAKKLLLEAQQKLDKAAKTNVISKNTASRLKSRLAHLIARSSKTTS